MITAIISRQQAIGMLRIANHRVEINYSVEMASGANPLVHRLPVSLAQRPGMIVV